PFEVHRLRISRQLGVMLFDQAGPARQLQDFVIAEREAAALFVRRLLTASGAAAVSVNHPHLLGAGSPPDDRAMAFRERRLEDRPPLGCDYALHPKLPAPVRAGHDDHVAEARFGVESEYHARAGLVGPDHRLYADRERDLQVVEAMTGAIADGAVGKERGEAGLRRPQQRFASADVEEGLLLPGERSFGQILCGG